MGFEILGLPGFQWVPRNASRGAEEALKGKIPGDPDQRVGRENGENSIYVT